MDVANLADVLFNTENPFKHKDQTLLQRYQNTKVCFKVVHSQARCYCIWESKGFVQSIINVF